MRAVGVIVEYNPFHNGHYYHLQQSRKITGADTVVAVMSGHFLQRGEPAMWDKWTRTRMALAGGCDLVIELPVAYATQAAEWFAYGSVSLLEATGVVDAFCFGTESGQLEPLQMAAELIVDEPPAFKTILKEQLATGTSYPSAFSTSISTYLEEQGYAGFAKFPYAMPNHTLALHYLLALKRIKGVMRPFTIARERAQYNQDTITDGEIASATALRKQLLIHQSVKEIQSYIPSTTYDIIDKCWAKGMKPISWDNYIVPLMHTMLTHSAQQLSDMNELSEGLEHRILNNLPNLTSANFEQLLSLLKTKRYTRTKLQRALLSILLGHRKSDFSPDKLSTGVQYIRVLGFSDKGRQLLKRMRTSSKLPVLMSAARPPQSCNYLEMDVQASNAYMLGIPDADIVTSLYRDYRDKPIFG
ncbi:nucleotidyltransferase [Paenibacillus sp. GSMTC-2017]|uniref:nucleotidyltransferase n=1 Tax=Paenibacillus sp. GSMTC-2017 TaxID=2794350 RepID=UPI0018D958FB|nr:nucleotidyltransferase [Paenibacillus sp. GSMTC-2017]MBH5316685.1 nucleotidyltransferase [Paenibacillus sp. GSMTC-2017]